MSLTSCTLRQVLLDAQAGDGITPSASQTLIVQGWAEWVDHEHGTPIDENSPRSILRLTVAGRERLADLDSEAAEPGHNTTLSQPVAAGAQQQAFH
jgi:hypothetical protein